MATLYIAEYARMCQVPNAGPQCPEEPPIAEQTVSIGGGALSSVAFQPTTTVLRLHCDAICSILIGAAPVATTSNQRFATNQTEFKGVPSGGQYKVSVISNV